MDLLVIRHAIAEEREDFARTGKPDALRPLTDRGRRRMRRGARGLRRLVDRLDVLATSPLTRATQTAEIVASQYPSAAQETLHELEPEALPDTLLPFLQAQGQESAVAVVGHEPHLSTVVSWLLSGRTHSFVTLAKGGAVLLRFEDAPAPGGAALVWALAPGQLRKLRR